MLTLGRGHRLFESVRKLSDESGASLVEDYERTSLDAIRQMVSIGMGISLFPGLYTRSEFRKEGNVVRLPIKGWEVQRTIGFFWRENVAGRAISKGWRPKPTRPWQPWDSHSAALGRT